MSAQIQGVYDFAVTTDHNTGDVWVGLSCLGLLGGAQISGVVITPACDLSNSKVETITYLPIIPVYRYVLLPCFFPHLMRLVNGMLTALGREPIDVSAPFGPVDSAIITTKLDEVTEVLAADPAAKTEAFAARAQSGLSLLRSDAPDLAEDIISLAFDKLGGTKSEEMLQKLIVNAFKPDIHFLPHDRQADAFSSVPKHSAAQRNILRYG